MTGLKHTKAVLVEAHKYPFTTRSNFARCNAELIAECACRGLISTLDTESEEHGNIWHITVLGMMVLRDGAELLP